MSRTYRRKDDWMGWKRWIKHWEAYIWLKPEHYEYYFRKFIQNPKRYNLDCYNSRTNTKRNKALKHFTAHKYRTYTRDCLQKFKTNATDIEMSNYYRYENSWKWF